MSNSREGFEEFVKITEGLKAKHGLSDVLIGLEPTGHYWRKFAYFAKVKGWEVRFVRTTALKHHRELDESSSAKSDKRDALTHITREGKCIDTVIEDGRTRHLRILVKVREKMQKRNVSAKNSLHAALDDYFPELHGIFWSMHSRGLWALLERCPFPEDVMTLEISALKEMIGRASRRGLEASQKAIAVSQAAKESIGLRQIGSADRYRLKMCLEEAKRTELTIKDIEREIKRTLKEIPEAEYLLSIPGIGPISAAVFLGELGNASYFPSARQVVKYAGYDPQESDSGYRVSRKFISKKGRWLLRKHLFLMSMRVVVLSRYFQEYYQRKLQTKNRFGQLPRKKEILCAVAIKLIKVIFALLRDKRNFEDTITCSVFLDQAKSSKSRLEA